ncbi:MAG TPA: hypothetical protein VGT04_10805 [Acidobacteriaceae bacterium]|nr:hypothetical protein [Acidobacteriaceae bacterium]
MELSRAQLLMLLLAAPGPKGREAEPIQGTTRLQKLMFLIEKEAGLQPTTGPDLEFTAYKFGPVSKALYDDLEKLENLGLLRSSPVSAASDTELDEYGLAFDDLIGEEEQESKGTFEEKQYSLTPRGLDWLESRIDKLRDESVLDGIRRVKGKYGALSLQDLLHHVYTRYPGMTSASEIKSRVLRR